MDVVFTKDSQRVSDFSAGIQVAESTSPDGERILSAPYAYLLPAPVPLRYLGGENFAHFWVHFFSRQLGRFGWFSDVREADFPAGAALLAQLLEALRPGAPDWNRAGELDRLLRQLLQPFLAQAPEPTESERTPPSAQMAELVDYIDRHLAEKLTVAALARHCRMTPEQLSDAFFAAYGMRPKHYLCLRRITQARRLLVTGKLPIKEIGRRVGYENVLFFHRQFRRYTGLTPAAYRACERTGE